MLIMVCTSFQFIRYFNIEIDSFNIKALFGGGHAFQGKGLARWERLFGGGDAAQLAAESGELVLLGGGEARHRLGNAGSVPGKDAADQIAAARRDLSADETAVLRSGRALGQTALLQVVEDHPQVTGGTEDLAREFAQAHRADVKKSLQAGERAASEPGLAQVTVGLGRHATPCPY